MLWNKNNVVEKCTFSVKIQHDVVKYSTKFKTQILKIQDFLKYIWYYFLILNSMLLWLFKTRWDPCAVLVFHHIAFYMQSKLSFDFLWPEHRVFKQIPPPELLVSVVSSKLPQSWLAVSLYVCSCTVLLQLKAQDIIWKPNSTLNFSLSSSVFVMRLWGLHRWPLIETKLHTGGLYYLLIKWHLKEIVG